MIWRAGVKMPETIRRCIEMMKKLLKAAAAAVFALSLAGCAKSEFSMRVNEDLNVEINAENATKGSNAMAGTFDLKDGQKIVVESEIDGEVLVKFYSVTNDAETLPVPDESAKPDFELTVNSSGKTEYDLAAGDYFVSSEAMAKTTGKIIISAK